MDVLSIEHNFGKEIETSIHQLFNYFCNNINLGQWQIAKACLKQLDANRKNFKFDFNQILLDLIENPETYSHGSFTLQSPYHLSLLLYEYCVENDYLKKRDEIFYDRILFKFIIYSSFLKLDLVETSYIDKEQNVENQIESKNSIQYIVEELVELIKNDLFVDVKETTSAYLADKSSISNLGSSVASTAGTSLSSSNSELITTLKLSYYDSPTLNQQFPEFSTIIVDYLKKLFLNYPVKAKVLLELIFKYNPNSQHTFLKVHLNVINSILDDMENNLNQHSLFDQLKNKLFTLLNCLNLYKIDTNLNATTNPPSSQVQSRMDNIRFESVALVQRCFRDLCFKFNTIWSEEFESLEENFRLVYSCFIFEREDDASETSLDQIENDTKINLLNLFTKIHYEVDRQVTISNTYNDESLPIISLIKRYSTLNKDLYLWRKLFLFCYIENKILLKSIIDECLLLISRSQYDSLMLIFSIKEFTNLKPLILLLGISKVQDIQSAKKLITILCLNSEKGLLIDKLGNLLKSHLDFMTWFQQIKSEHRTKHINFNDLIKLLHRQLPINIISQYLEITKLDNSEMTKILRNTLTEKDTSQKKTKWVRFVDEVNEKISLTQETCLATYNGFYCINEVLNSILYCCENLNRKFYMTPSSPKKNSRKSSVFSTNESNSPSVKPDNETKKDDDIKSEEALKTKNLQMEYKTNVIEKFDFIRKTINQIQPLNYRLEILENIYSLIYLSSNDLKDADEKSKGNEEDYSDDDLDMVISSKQKLSNKSETTLTTNRSSNLSESFEILSTSVETNQRNVPITASYDVEFSIYATENPSTVKQEGITSNQKQHSQSISSNSSRKFYREYSSNGGNEEDEEFRLRNSGGSLTSLYKNNMVGGGTFLVNDFLCRDILLMVKDLVQTSFKLTGTNNVDASFNHSHCSIQTPAELNARLAKFQQIVNETLWRFQIVKCDLVQMDYGKVNNLFMENLQSAKSVNDRQENMIYELMKERKRRRSSASLGPITISMVAPASSIPSASNLNNGEQILKRNESKSSLAKHKGITNSTLNNKQNYHRSHESQRSLSIIYPMNKHKRSNLTIMKLLANIETLSTLCLKEFKFNEANQLVKMYASKKEACKSFEFREIIFYSVYQKTIDELNKLNRIQNQQQNNNEFDLGKKQRQNLIDLSMQSLDMAKITENLLSFVDKDDELLKCIFLCDAITISNIDLKVAANLIDYARIKLNQNLIGSKTNEKTEIVQKEVECGKLNKKSKQNDLYSSSDSGDENLKKPHTKFKRKMKSLPSNLYEKKDSSNENLSSSINTESLNQLEAIGDKNEAQEELNRFTDELKSKLLKFIESTETICAHFQKDPNKNSNEELVATNEKPFNLIDYLFSVDGICIGLNGELLNKNALFETIQVSIEKYETFKNLYTKLDILKRKFESTSILKSDDSKHEIFFNITNILSQTIKLTENEDVISSFFYKPNPHMNPLMKQVSFSATINGSPLNSNNNDSTSDIFLNNIERYIYKSGLNMGDNLSSSASSLNGRNYSSNYLLSFYEYCKTLYEYFKEKSLQTFNNPSNSNSTLSFFSILNSSPASLICKLLFEDGIKPQLIESLTQKLNLNLTAIILHNSCPRLKVTLAKNKYSLAARKSLTSSHNNMFLNEQSTLELSTPSSNDRTQSNEEDFNKDTSSFYTILNEEESLYCSIKKPDEFLRTLLLKILKYTKSYLDIQRNKLQEESQQQQNPNQSSSNSLINNFSKHQKRSLIDLKDAKEMYKSAEFKSLLNESKELQHLNLNALKTDKQKLSFFINLYNLLSIHSHFYLANKCNFQNSSDKIENEKTFLSEDSFGNISLLNANKVSEFLFRNRTEKLLFEQRMCYKVGQMGCISLYDLKHHILTRRCLNKDTNLINKTKASSQEPPIVPTSKTTPNKLKTKNSKSNETPLKSSQSPPRPLSASLLAQQTCDELFKYSFYTLDPDAEPLWAPYLPSDSACDFRILFALTNCTESDPPMCVYNSDDLLEEQLSMQMKMFLNESVHADLCYDSLYLPAFIIENCSFFLSANDISPASNTSSVLAKLTSTNSNSDSNDLEVLIRILMSYVNDELKESMQSLLDLDSIHGNIPKIVDHYENIDHYGRRELPFPIEKISTSNKFALITEYAGDNSWYKRKIQVAIKKKMLNNKKNLKAGVILESETMKTNCSCNDDDEDDLNNDTNVKQIDENEEFDVKMDDFIQPENIKQQLNKDCLEYIQKNSNLIANSLSFLFDVSKRQEFFLLLSDITSSEYEDQDINLDTAPSALTLNNPLNRFIQLYVPLDYMKHLSMQTKLNLITQFLLTNKTEESKIELIIDLANYYAQSQEWDLVLNLLNNSTQDNEELNELTHRFGGLNQSDNSDRANLTVSEDGRFSQKDLYNLYDHACICRAYQEAKKNEKSFFNLFKMKNFLRQIRAIFGLMYLWNIDECLILIEYCLTKSKLYEQPGYSQISEITDNYSSLVIMINNKKIEFTAYKELVTSARQTLEQYYEHQQIQDAAGFYDNNQTNEINDSTVNLNKMKRVCQKCLTWQYAKNQLESSSSRDEEETNELIMDLFLLNDKFTSAKYLIRKLKLSKKLQFKLDFGHLKHRLLHLNASSSIIVIDFEAILKECISFGDENNSNSNEKHYEFEICFRLLNELKDLNELNNQVLISLTEFLIEKYKHLLKDHQMKEFKIIQLTARIFQILVQKRGELPFDSYKRHHSAPLLIIEQLLMNSQIELAKKTIKLCRDTMNDPEFHSEINQLLVRYARKALEFKIYINSKTAKVSESEDTLSAIKSRSPQPSNSSSALTKNSNRKSSVSINISTVPLSNNNNNNSSMKLSSSFKSFYKLSSLGTNSNNNLNLTNSNTNQQSSSLNTIISPSNMLSISGSSGGSFVMPAIAPSKEDWVKDDDVQECMVCNTRRFTLLNRRHHCRRCGRVVCSNCSERVTLIENIPRRTCDDCFRQIELQKVNEKLNSSDKNIDIFSTSSSGKSYLETKRQSIAGHSRQSSLTSMRDINMSNKSQQATNENVSLIESTNENNESTLCWQLMGGTDETSQKRDEKIRNSFRYQQAPSTSLCLSILDLNDQPLECGKDLLSMCDNLSNFLQTANYQVEDFALIINMIKHLLHNAKVKLLQNSSTNIISLCDTYLSLIDVLEQLLLANCSNIPSLYELRNTESARRIRNRLLEEERHDLAMNMSTKCGLDSQTVWASWGMLELRRGNYNDARSKFEKCLKGVNDKNISINQPQLKILNDILNYFENAPPIRMLGPQTLLAPLRSVDSLIAEPKLYSAGNSTMDDLQLKEVIFYLETYGNYSLMLGFYQSHGYLENSLQYLMDKKCSSDVFIESLLVPSLKNGEFYRLLENMLNLERSQSKLYVYYASIGKYLEKNSYLHTLYDFQLLMKDYVRACMSCLCFFTRNAQNYIDLFKNVQFLAKAKNHLEQYYEVCSLKQQSNSVNTQQQWKQKPEQQNLCKQMSIQEVNNYLNAINLQMEVTKFINNCFQENKKEEILNKKIPTLFGSNDTKINLCCLVLLSGQSIQEGFGFVIRIVQCFNLNSTLVYSQIARELAKQYNFKQINNLLRCISESGYIEDVNSSYDECISTCIRVFAAAVPGSLNNDQPTEMATANTLYVQQYNKEIEDLINLIKNEENKINAYILNGRLKSAYLIAIRIDRADIVKHIGNVAERMGHNSIKDICNKWLEKKQQTSVLKN